jgi:hypothetical protein
LWFERRITLSQIRPTRRGGLDIGQQAIWEFPDVSRVPVEKHPVFGRYFWALFEAVAGRDLMTSFDRPRAESSPPPKLVAASTTAIIAKDPNSDSVLIVEPLLSVASRLSRQSRYFQWLRASFI